MFVGLPSHYRKSILYDIAKQPSHSLESAVCENKKKQVKANMKIFITLINLSRRTASKESSLFSVFN